MSGELFLETDIRRAIETYMGGTVTGPWDAVIEGFTRSIIHGQLTLDQASRIDLALRAVGDNSPDDCPTCNRGLSRHDGMSW